MRQSNRKKHIVRGAVLLLLTLVLCFVQRTPVTVLAEENTGTKQVDMVFTHDLHSYLQSHEIEENGERISIGGLARLKTVLDEKRAQNPDLLVVDAGDIVMGTLFQTLTETDAVELRMLGKLRFDATTFGNHEFDYGSAALANMFETAAEKESYLPYYVICNIDWSSENKGSRAIYEAVQKCNLRDYVVLEKGNTKIAVTGVLGEDALKCAPTCELTVLDPIKSVKDTVKKIKENEDVDMIVCISHSGTWSDPKKSEDEQLAKAVPDLDIIVSGHTHTKFTEPIVYDNTYIVCCGSYGAYTGTCSLSQKEDGRWNMQEYELIPMTDDIAEDTETAAQLSSFETTIDEKYLGNYGCTADQVLAWNNITFETVADLEQNHTEQKLGNLMSDAYRYAVNLTPSGSEHPVDVAVVPSGTVRGTYLTGEVKVKDVFESFSLGSGKDGSVGYPLISVYLTGEELKTAAEVDASISDYMMTARLYASGLSFSYNPHRMLLNKVTDCWISSAMLEDSRTEIEDDRLYRVVTDLYSGRMLGAVTELSKGLLKIIPKDENGQPIERLEDAIIYDAEGKEVKAWVSIANYLSSFEKNENGVSVIPPYYASYHNRKVVEEEKTPVALLKNPSRFFIGICILVLLIILLAVVITRMVIMRKRRRKIMNKE